MSDLPELVHGCDALAFGDASLQSLLTLHVLTVNCALPSWNSVGGKRAHLWQPDAANNTAYKGNADIASFGVTSNVWTKFGCGLLMRACDLVPDKSSVLQASPRFSQSQYCC